MKAEMSDKKKIEINKIEINKIEIDFHHNSKR